MARSATSTAESDSTKRSMSADFARLVRACAPRVSAPTCLWQPEWTSCSDRRDTVNTAKTAAITLSHLRYLSEWLGEEGSGELSASGCAFRLYRLRSSASEPDSGPDRRCDCQLASSRPESLRQPARVSLLSVQAWLHTLTERYMAVQRVSVEALAHNGHRRDLSLSPAQCRGSVAADGRRCSVPRWTVSLRAEFLAAELSTC